MHSDRAEYPAKAKPKPLTRFIIHRKASNSNAFPALVAALIAYIEVLAGQAILSNWFWTGSNGLGPMGGARLSTHRVGLSNFSAKNTPVTPRIPTVSPWEPLAPMSQPAPETLPRPFRGTSVLLPSLFRCLQPDFPHCFRLSVCESRGIFYLG